LAGGDGGGIPLELMMDGDGPDPQTKESPKRVPGLQGHVMRKTSREEKL
jgi:hypothetical protein